MTRRMSGRAVIRLAGALLLAALAGCTPKKDDRSCPKVEVVGDLARLVQFGAGPGRDPSDIVFIARIADVKTGCIYDKRGARVDMIVSIAAVRGRAAAKLKNADVSYFVAITDDKQEIVEKKIFTSKLDFSQDEPRIDDQLDQIIPLHDRSETAANDTIIVGFQLTPEQIDLNQQPQRN